jgi:hypothetical protein
VALVEWGELATVLYGPNVLTIQFEIDDQEGRWLDIDGALAGARVGELDRWARK